MDTRAGPLSNDKVIDLLNSYFVPITTSNEDYNANGGATPQEKFERERVVQQARRVEGNPNAGAADVCGYVLAPDGRVLSTLRLPPLSETPQMIKWLQDTIDGLETKPGEMLVKATGVTPPDVPAGGIRLHAATRYLLDSTALVVSKDVANLFGNQFANRMRALSRVPTEDWVQLSKEECQSLVGPATAVVNDHWTIDRKIAEKLLDSFRPSSTNNHPNTRRFDVAKLTATLESNDGGTGRVRLEGKMRIRCPFLLFRDDDHYIEASLLGYLDYDTTTRQIKTLRIVTDKGTWVGLNFGAALKSVP